MNTWLWPNHNIGKRKSGELREEHNAAVNQNAKLLQAVNDKDQELFESQELVAELLEACYSALNAVNDADYEGAAILLDEAIRKASK